MTKAVAIETADRLLCEALTALRGGHLTIAESKAEQAQRRLAAFRVQEQTPDANPFQPRWNATVGKWTWAPERTEG